MTEKLPIPHKQPFDELEEQIRQLCRRLIGAKGEEFESACAELSSALDIRDRIKDQNE